MDPAQFDEVVGPDPGFSDTVAFEVKIGDGHWVEYEINDGVPHGVGWKGRYTTSDGNTFIAKDLDSPCEITYGLTQFAGEMAVDIAHEDCTDPNDIFIQTAMYESAPFHLVEGPDRTVPDPDRKRAGVQRSTGLHTGEHISRPPDDP